MWKAETFVFELRLHQLFCPRICDADCFVGSRKDFPWRMKKVVMM